MSLSLLKYHLQRPSGYRHFPKLYIKISKKVEPLSTKVRPFLRFLIFLDDDNIIDN